MAKIIALIVMAGVLAATVICRPAWLSENQFLLDFANHEVLALMSVILTVTLASVANIHLALNRIVAKRFGGNEQLKTKAKEVKKELNDNAWLIFWGFVASIFVLLVKGLNMDDGLILAISHASIIWMLFLFIVCMYDIYRVVFGIVDLEMEIGVDVGTTEDYTSDSPELGKD